MDLNWTIIAHAVNSARGRLPTLSEANEAFQYGRVLLAGHAAR